MTGQQISPELVLVSPDLRGRALEELPARDPEALFVVAPRAPLAPPRVEPRAPLPMAIAAYVMEALFLGAVRGALMFLAIAVAAFLLAR
jgi:hypothetical protein